MIPTVTAVRLTGARNRADLPLLVLGPSLGTSATALWTHCAAHLRDAFDLLAWDLPGHGHNRAVPEEPFTMAELAEGVSVSSLFVRSGLAKSGKDAKRLIADGELIMGEGDEDYV